jgi:hypothetical protein
MRFEMSDQIFTVHLCCVQCQLFAGNAGFAQQTAFGFFTICFENHLHRFEKILAHFVERFSLRIVFGWTPYLLAS